MPKFFAALVLSLILAGCSPTSDAPPAVTTPLRELPTTPAEPDTLSASALVLLGTLQDAGSPHIACRRDCCRELFDHPDPTRQVISLGLFDASTNGRYLFEATPDIARQAKTLSGICPGDQELPDGIFLTHAHVGHYAGLMYLGKEATNADAVPVYAMPRMRTFLTGNGPWSQLVTEGNIELRELSDGEPVRLSDQALVTPLRVPHRDEYSETVGYRIAGPNHSALFLPDIDKWEKWDRSIEAEIARVDYAFLDATFFSGSELGDRDMRLIPHPFIVESLDRFALLPPEERRKIVFIHFNHTNPVLNMEGAAAAAVRAAGMRIGRYLEVFPL